MVALDSLYAMLARPVQRVVKRKRVVDQTEHIDPIHADSHEAPQSQLPPHLERRRQGDRRINPRPGREDRRGQARRQQAQKQAEEEALDSPLPHIDIDV
ncbi:hypothetical protein L1D32_11275 [Shewanella insulae]|uniref:hypothetical protein n=1 Tax=Shewanella insulae TaxID=2681496 RepID=UPI001EFC3BDC|nr:hypothetical protein [Shewanella insulae]MCG9713781.1 hypothetical protein [Shewanella insulae]MCG9738740.1 hypothetical protein [Shewanella insulae]MCG9754420.1 hypothetical protein [Shewanella insulae]